MVDDGLSDPRCAFCSFGLVGAQASATSCRCCDHPFRPKEATSIHAPCRDGHEYCDGLRCVLECASRSRCRPVVEDAAASRGGDEHCCVLDKRACPSGDQEPDRSSSSQSIAGTGEQTVDGEELSE